MPRTVPELLDAARELTRTERIELAELLLESVGPEPKSLHPAWPAELRRRSDEIESGAVRGVPLDEVNRRAEEILNEDD